jgi:hypothetical protein
MRTITKNSKSSVPPKMIAAVVFALLIATVGVFMWLQQPKKQDATTTPQVTDNHQPTKEETANKPAPSNVPSADVPVSTALGVTITKLEQANGSVVISGSVTGATAGTCVAEFTTAEDKPVIKEIKATASGTSATCGPITIDEVEFSYLGDWSAKLTFYTADQSHQASSAAKTITIK